ncbi:MAG: SH3 domain-containing protein [Bacteroidota bacterium]
MKIKSFLFSIAFYAYFTQVATGQQVKLKQADSLFSLQKYTEAYTTYRSVFDTGEVTPAMLLKMAFIKDASEDYVEALFLLDKYYQLSADRQAVGKIMEIAEEQGLSGYKYSDQQYFLALLTKYKTSIAFSLLSISALLISYTYMKTRKSEKSYVAGVLQAMVLVLLLGLVNVRDVSKGIITKDRTLLRTGPSSGSESIATLSKGHKVIVLEETEVWTKIRWEGEDFFINKERILII